MLYRIKVYKNGKYLGNYKDGFIKKGKPTFYYKDGYEFFLPYVEEQFSSPEYKIITETKADVQYSES